MLTQILFFNISRFALAIFSAFTFFAAGLLYYDSWKLEKSKKSPLLRSVGLFCLALVASLHTTTFSAPALELLMQLVNIAGLLAIFLSLISEPILHKPGKDKLSVVIPLMLPAITKSLIPLSGMLTLFIAISYYKKATGGLEKQLKPAAVAFFFLALAEFTNISQLWSNTNNVFISKMLTDFSALWVIHHLLQLIGIVILAVWVWGYIRFRLQVQMFTIIVGSSLAIFLSITFFFVFLLLKNLETDALSHLKTDIDVLQYALNRQQSEALSDAKAIAQDSGFNDALANNNQEDLYQTTSDFMLSQETDFLTVASQSGEVLMRAEDREQLGDNISEDPVVKSALLGTPLSTIITSDNTTVPEVFIKAAAPTHDNGVVVTGFIIDSAFVDGIKDVTGLDTAVFSNNIQAATTFTAPDGKSRFVGTMETNNKIISTVLEKGEIYVGSATVLNLPYYTAYSPLKTLGDKTIGMLFVGKPQTTLIAAAQKSINLTFLGSAILMIISTVPAYFLSKYIKENTKA